MNRQQKIAWFNIAVVAFAILLSGAGVLWLAVAWKAGFPGSLSASGLLSVVLLHLLGPAIFHKKKQAGEVLFDERDTQISERAILSGNIASNTFYVLAFLCALLVLGLQGQMRAYVLGPIVCGAYCSSLLTQSLATLILYGRKPRDGDVGINQQETDDE